MITAEQLRTESRQAREKIATLIQGGVKDWADKTGRLLAAEAGKGKMSADIEWSALENNLRNLTPIPGSQEFIQEVFVDECISTLSLAGFNVKVVQNHKKLFRISW